MSAIKLTILKRELFLPGANHVLLLFWTITTSGQTVAAAPLPPTTPMPLVLMYQLKLITVYLSFLAAHYMPLSLT